LSSNHASSESWRRLEAVVHEVGAAPSTERTARLEALCAGDGDLLEEASSLLHAIDEEERITASFVPPELREIQETHIGRRVGPYELKRLLGRGGTGAVYLARRADGQFDQQVAIKLIDLPLVGSLFRERFRQERQILAGLNHPCIARLLDGGVSEEGELYLAMEYADGLPIQRYCEQHSLDIRERIELFKSVCTAVRFAHQNLVVHRDLKPGNILVTTDGTAKLVCLPGHAHDHQLSLGVALSRILDVGWKGGLLVAGWAADSTNSDQSSGEELVLFAPNGGPRRLSKGVRTARFSSDGAALAYEVAEPRNSSAGSASATSYVLDLDTGKVTALGALADPLWEADGKHLRATRLRTGSDDGAQWSSLRVRWERESGIITMDGPGSAQIPAPVGEIVAWSEDQRGVPVPGYCTVRLGRGMVKHLVVGRFCMGIADDRSVRWSPDGRWLAFPHPGPMPGDPGGEFIDVVGIEGGRFGIG